MAQWRSTVEKSRPSKISAADELELETLLQTLRAMPAAGAGPPPSMTRPGDTGRVVDFIRWLERKHLSVDTRDEEGGTALMLAASDGAVDALRGLLGVGADIDARDSAGATALAHAAEANQLACLRLLIEAGADLDADSGVGHTALMCAAAAGAAPCARELLAAGADVNARRENGARALAVAARSRQPACLVAIIDAPYCDVNAGDFDGATALMRAAAAGAQRCVEILLAAGAAPAQDDDDGVAATVYAERARDEWDAAVAALTKRLWRHGLEEQQAERVLNAARRALQRARAARRAAERGSDGGRGGAALDADAALHSKRATKASFLLYTVTFYANLAHSLTRSP